MTSTRSVSTTPSRAAMFRILTSKPVMNRPKRFSVRVTAAFPRSAGKGTFW